MKCRLLLDIVVGQGSSILELFAGENQTLLIRGDALLVLDLRLDVVDGVAGLDIEGDGLTREGFDEYLHGCSQLVVVVCFRRLYGAKEAANECEEKKRLLLAAMVVDLVAMALWYKFYDNQRRN